MREAARPDASPSTILPWMPATVPGGVHLDLMRAGVIANPFYRMMERGVGWVDEADWVYETTLTVEDPPAHAFLRFKGLDTIADIVLNGEPLGSADNMFIEHEFPVSGRLTPGENTLTVTFHSALAEGRRRRAEWAASGEDTMEPEWFAFGPRSFVRKAQYMYGWDWGPEPVSGGLWRDVELVTVPVARLLDWRHDVRFHEDGRATVVFEAFFERAPGHEETPLLFRADLRRDSESGGEHGHDGAPVEAPTGAGRLCMRASVEVANPRLWWPNGMGEPNLYVAALSLCTPDSEAVDGQTAPLGLRTVELVREPDADGLGESFQFRVNGQDVFIKGANWIPVDSFPGRVPTEPASDAPEASIVERLLTMARDAHHNMVRIWGGGFYESDHFYDVCDRLGLLVWQDFPYACAYYPDRGRYVEAAREEAVAAVRRLRNRASLALWCGNNENSMMHYHRWSGDNTPPRLLGETLYHETLPAVVQEEDPGRAYWPSSPYGGEDPNGSDYGDRHNWDVWHSQAESRWGGDWPGYAEDRPRFCSEFGFASSCGLAAWDTVLDDGDKHPRSAAVRWHDKTRKGYDTYLGYVTRHYPDPQTLADLVYYSQCNQAEALKFGIEHFRRLKGRCWGTLYWQLNDCWPVQSWSVIDYIGQPKAAWYAARRFYAPLLLSLVRPEDADQAEAHLTNDRMAPACGTVSLRLETFAGEVLAETSAPCAVDPNGTARVASLNLGAARGREREACVLARFTPDDGREAAENVLLLAEPKDLLLADPGLTVDVSGNRVTVSARRFAPYVWLRLINLDGDTPPVWEDNFFHLHPGETRTVTVSAPYPLSGEEIRARLTVRTL